MNKFLIKNYISKLKKDDIVTYIKNNNLQISSTDEIDIIYYYIKEKNYLLFDNNIQQLFSELKEKLSLNTFIEIVNIYNKYKKFI